jgi:hypothetical protein
MKREDKQRLLMIGAIIAAAVILWLLLRGKGALNNIIYQNGGSIALPNGAGNFPSLASLPPVDFIGGNYVGGSISFLMPGSVADAMPPLLASSKPGENYDSKPSDCALCYTGAAHLRTASPALQYQPSTFDAVRRFYAQSGRF